MALNIVGIQLRLHPREKYTPTSNEYKVIEGVHPCYYRVGTYAFRGRKYISVLYQIYYAFNGAIGLNGIFPSTEKLGAHDKDIERVVILHDLDTKEPLWVFVSAHAQEGTWHPFEDCEKAPENRIVIYAAIGSHRHSITPGVKWRVLGFANDYCSKYGKHLNLTLYENNDIGFTIQNREVLDTTYRAFFYPMYQRLLPSLVAQQQKEESQMNANIV